MVDWYYDESGKGATALEVTLELVEQLRQHANVSFADAKAALEHTDGDLLEALIWLEQQGKIDLAGVGSYHTGPDAPNPRQAPPRQDAPPPQPEGWLSRAWRVLTENRLECTRGDKRFEIPLAVLIALVLFAVYVVVIALILGFCFGWRFRFAGPELGRKSVNDVMDQIDDAAGEVRERLRREWENHKNK